jgi:hypothetical protein
MIRNFIRKIAQCFDEDNVSFVLYPLIGLIEERHSIYTIKKFPPTVKLLFTMLNNNIFDLYINKIMVDLEDDERKLIKEAVINYEERERLLKEQKDQKKEIANKKLLEEAILQIDKW